MTIENLFTDNGVAVNLTLLPNGIIMKKGKAFCGFSLLFGIHLVNDGSKSCTLGDDPYVFFQQFTGTINTIMPYLRFRCPDQQYRLLLENRTGPLPFEAKQERLWRHMLQEGGNSFKLERTSTFDFKGARNNKTSPFYDKEFLKTVRPPYNPANTIMKYAITKGATVTPHLFDNYLRTSALASTNTLILRKKVFGTIKAGGKIRSNASLKKRATPGATQDSKNLLQVFNGIYLQPRMAREFGLLYDIWFEIDNGYLGPGFFPDKLRKYNLELVVAEADLRLISLPLSCIGKLQVKNGYAYLSTFEAASCKFKRDGRTLYFHGAADFGIIRKSDLAHSFATIDPDHKSQNSNQSNQAYTQAVLNNTPRVDYSQHKQPQKQGIYMIQLPEKDGKCKPVRVSPNGVLGQNVLVAVNDKTAPSALYSLCARKALYDMKHEANQVIQEEEGWIHTNLLVHGVNDTYYNGQTIFHWTGQNLCLSKPKSKNKDQVIKDDPAHGTGGIDGLYDNGEDDLLKKRAFQVRYKNLPEANCFLAAGNKYSFLIRDVLANGYTFPIRAPKNSSILCINDMLSDASFSTKNWFDFYEGDPSNNIFTLDDVPVNPPTLYWKDLKTIDPKTDASATGGHIVLGTQGKRTDERLVFPPKIELQFASMLGLLTPETLQPLDHDEYMQQCCQLLQRATHALLPTADATRTVDYLADTRGRDIMISAADWFSKSIYPGKLTFDDFFPYKTKGDVYQDLQNRILEAKGNEDAAGTAFTLTNPDGKILANIAPGLELSFFIRFHNKQLSSQMSAYKLTLKEQQKLDRVRGMYYVDETSDNPCFPKQVFALTHATLKPAKKAITLTRSAEVQRPGAGDDRSKIFYAFSLAGLYAYGFKQIQMVSKATTLGDQPGKLPPQQDMDNKKSDWQNQYAGIYELLESEYPASVFEQDVRETEIECYRNHFGVGFRFTNDMVSSLLDLDQIWHLKFCQEMGLCLYFNAGSGKGTLAQLPMGSAPIPIDNIPPIDLSAGNIVIIGYDFDVAKRQLKTSITVNGVAYPLVSAAITNPLIRLPHMDLSEKYLGLLPQLEQKLIHLPSESIAGKTRYGVDAFFSFIHNGDFFVYRTEKASGLIEKEMTCQAISRFHEFFPDKAYPSKFVSESPVFKLPIPNNLPLVKPEFKIIPLLLWEKQYGKGLTLTSSRSMQLLFEIERPLGNGEKFAIILAEVTDFTGGTINASILSTKTSAIGNDFISYGDPFPITDGSGKAITLRNFLSTAGQFKYLDKYRISPANYPEVLRGEDGKTYEMLVLDPYFETAKQKWIVALGFDDFKLANENGVIPRYNPFLKVVTARYNVQSTPGNQLSSFTLPKYINILSRRTVSIKKETLEATMPGSMRRKKMRAWKITIDNPAIIKKDFLNNAMTAFVVVIRQQGNNGITGKIIESCAIQPNATTGNNELLPDSRYQLVPANGELLVKHMGDKMVCVYEFETFKNTPDLNKVSEWLDDHAVRLIYAEEFDW